jgi:hypothetical protein
MTASRPFVAVPTDAVYAEVAEFYDIVGAEVWRRKAPLLAQALASVHPGDGPIVDVGAGTGLSTAAIASAVPGAAIIAAEPCTPMRIALTTRVAADTGLRRRVTVVPDGALDLDLPERLAAACCLGVVGHLTAAERTRLWAGITCRLGPGAPLVIELLDRTAPPSRRRMRVGRAKVGDQTYEVWSTPLDTTADGVRRWTFTYRVLRHSALRREVTAPMTWTPVTADDLAREFAAFGLTARQIAPDLVVARTQAR